MMLRLGKPSVLSTQYLVLSTAYLLALPAISGGYVAVADEPTALASPAVQFKTLYDDWNSVEKQLSGLQDRYQNANPAVRTEIKKQYEQLVERSKELLPHLAAAGE